MSPLRALLGLLCLAPLLGARPSQDEDPPSLTELQPAINAAIDGGVAALLRSQLLDGSWPDHQSGYRNGATSLCVYALIKSGLNPAHPSVRRALTYIEHNPPRKTYEVGCNLLLELALEREAPSAAAQEMLDDLLAWQHGDFGYAAGSGADLSNTQYGALALWAAKKLGLVVPADAWSELAERTLEYRQAEAEGQPISGARGFTYRPGQAQATGSMTTAGVSILAICAPHLTGRVQTQAAGAMRDGLGWLGHHFSSTSNPFGGAGWYEYYLYGVERVGALTEVDLVGEHDWYLEGARALVSRQQPTGTWSGNNAKTSFALLFLSRATAPVSGVGGNVSMRTYGGDDPAVAVNLRASGDSPLTLWISSFGDEVHEQWTFADDEERGPRVLSVEYLAPGGVLIPRAGEGQADWFQLVRAPADGWTEPGFDRRGWRSMRMGLGSTEHPSVAAATRWTSDEVWLRHEFEVDRAALVEPRLEVCLSSQRVVTNSAPQVDVLKLYDEESEFPAHLTRGQAESSTTQLEDGPRDNRNYLHVVGQRRDNPRISGWSFPIREEPEPGEFRFLRLRWRAGGAGVMVELLFDGGHNEARRFYSGELGIQNLRPTPVQLDDKAPSGWEEVVIDVWQHARDRTLTGIGLTPMEGEAWFDEIYLGREENDFNRLRRVREAPVLWGREPEGVEAQDIEGAGTELLELWLNGQRIPGLTQETRGYEVVVNSAELLPHFVEGTNLLALRARNSEAGRSLDVSLRDQRLLARIEGDAFTPTDFRRYATQARFPRPGSYEIRARVRLRDEDASEPGVLESPPLIVQVLEAGAEALYGYADDAAQNLLNDNVAQRIASSKVGNLGPELALDNSQARGWMSYPGDAAPRLSVSMRRAARADTLLLSPLSSTIVKNQPYGRPRRAHLFLNGEEDPLVIAFHPDAMTKTVVDLGRPVRLRSFELLIIDWERGEGGAQRSTGLAEVELQLRDAR